MTGALLPQVGDYIYIDTILHLEHGEDDIQGGKVKVTSVKTDISAGKTVHFVTVEGMVDSFNWETYLAPLQSQLKERFGNQPAYPKPDTRQEFNT